MTAYEAVVCDGGEDPCADCYVWLTRWAIDLVREHPIDSYGDPGAVRDWLNEADRVWHNVIARGKTFRHEAVAQ